MILAATASGSCAVVPRNDSAQSFFSPDFAFGSGRKIWPKNLVPDVFSLMRPVFVIVRQPFAVNVIQLIKAYADKMVQALFLKHADTAFDVSIGLRSPHRRFKYFSSRFFPEPVKTGRVFEVAVMDQKGVRSKKGSVL